MKLIDLIRPIGSSSPETLKSKKGQFLQRIHGSGSDPLDYLKKMAVQPEFYPKTDILNHLIECFDHILVSEPLQLEAIIKCFEKNNWQKVIDDDPDFRTDLLNAFGYKERFRSNINRGIWYAETLNIKTCPYCNSQYTLTVNTGNSKLAKFQFDHFYSKSKYPYLSLSMYNLIPSCASCNLTKLDDDCNLSTHYHPYHLNLAEYISFRVVEPENVEHMSLYEIHRLTDSDIKIGLHTPYSALEEWVMNHYKGFHIEGLYNRHKDLVREIMIKAKLYQGEGIKFPLGIKGLFEDELTVLHYLLGTYMREDQILERPLTKLIQDIARQFKLIT